MKKFHFLLLLILPLLMGNSIQAQSTKTATTVEIGTEAETGTGLPMDAFTKHSYSQSLYLQSELNQTGKRITSILYHYNGNSAWNEDIVIYMGHTDKTTFANENDWVPIQEMQNVFSGNVSFPKEDGWVEIKLIDPFFYNNEKNLVIAFDNNTPAFHGYSDHFFGSNTEGALSLVKSEDYSNPDPANPPAGETMTKRPNVKLIFNDPATSAEISIPINTIDFGFVATESHIVNSLPIYNTGSTDLIINQIEHNNTAFGTDAAFPVTIAAGTAYNLNLIFNPHAAETFSDDIIIKNNSGIEPHITVNGSAYTAGSLVDGFEPENTMLPMWSMSDAWEIIESNISAHSGSYYALMNADVTDTLITPLLAITPEDTLSFFAKKSTSEGTMSLIYSSDKTTWTLLENIDVSIGWERVTSQLESLSGNYFIGLVTTKKIYLDDVIGPILALEENDLEAKSITGSTNLAFSEEGNYTITITNNGASATDNYSVQLLDAENTVLATAPGTSINILETQSIDLTWTSATHGTFMVKGNIVFDDDDKPENNTTQPLAVTVNDPNAQLITIGQGTDLQNKVPANFYYQSSLTESIYFAEELGNNQGVISSLSYKTQFAKPANDKPLRIWMGNTDSTSLTNGWIPSTDMQLVFDNTINVAAGEGEMIINLNSDAPFIYTGKNLVIMVERPLDTEYIGSSEKFYSSETTDKPDRTVEYKSDTKPLNPQAPTGGTLLASFANIQLVCNTASTGILSGTVKDAANTAIADANVEMVFTASTYAVITNEDGTYNMPFALKGEQTVRVSKQGYENTEASVTISTETPATKDFILSPLPKVTVKGHIAANDGSGDIANAQIHLTGYAPYEATTDASGNFTIDNVLGNKSYDVTISAAGYINHTATIAITNEVMNMGEIKLDENPVPVNTLTANTEDNKAKINWNKPGNYPVVDFIYDDGTSVGQLGFKDATQSMMGTVWHKKAEVRTVSWYLTGDAAHDKVDLYIFGLTASGAPDKTNVLYAKTNVNNTDKEWNTHTLDTPVMAEEGFFVGITTTGFISIGVDDGIDAPYEFAPNTMFATLDWKTKNWFDLASQDIKKNFLIRANGKDMGSIEKTTPTENNAIKAVSNSQQLIFSKSKSVEPLFNKTTHLSNNSKSFTNYTLYRLKKGQPIENWTELTTITDTFYTDEAYNALPWGVYQYAVVANYSKNSSIPVLSNVLNKEMNVSYTINVTANTNISCEGAVATLINNEEQDKTYTATANTEGKISFPEVWRGTYTLTITLENYDTFTNTALNITETGSLDTQLSESLIAPENLKVDINNKVHTFIWNEEIKTYGENFDALDDFAISFGEFTLNDVDQSTTAGFQNNTFPNAGAKMAAMVFNPSQTDPAMTQASIQAHSGAKFAAFFCANTPPNNDWMILPKFMIEDGFNFSFYAKSFTEQYGKERFKVAVSTSGTTPEDFTYISEGDFIEAPADAWTQYSYNLNSYSGQEIYIAIQCVSDNAFIFMVDDLFIGPEATKSTRAMTNYEVYLDGVKKTTTTENTYVFDNTTLVDGQEYTAGVKTIYTSGESELSTIAFTADMNIYWPVTLDMGTTDAKEAAVVFSNTSNNEIVYNAIVGSNGQVNLPKIMEGTYNLSVTKAGFYPYSEENIEVKAAVSKTINFVALATPVSLAASITNHDVALEWLAPGTTPNYVKESFEGEWAPKGWSTITTNSAKTFTKSGAVSFNGGIATPHSGTKHAFCSWGEAKQDEWLITPQVAISDGDKLTFWTYATYGSDKGDHYYVKASKDDGTTWDILWDASTQPQGVNKYDTPVSLDLSAYKNETIKLAWNCVDGDEQGLWYVFFVDAITVGNNGSALSLNMDNMSFEAKGIKGYNIFRDGNKLNNELITETTFADANVAIGAHNYTVSAVYDEGESVQSAPLAVNVGTPVLKVDKNAMNVAMESGSTTTEQLTLSNEGETELTYTINIEYIGQQRFMARENAEATTTEWLTIDTPTGTIASDDDKALQLTFNSNALTVKEYKAMIIITSNDPASSPKLIPVVYDIVEGLNTLNNAEANIYPNPAQDVVNIKTTSKIEMVRIITLEGREVFSATSQGKQLQISTTSLQSGVYFVETETTQGTSTQKLIIQ